MPTGNPGQYGICTAWIINRPSSGTNKLHLSAGHCAIPTGSVLQFNVPQSQADCSWTNPSTNYQFAVDAATKISQYSGASDDYSVFWCHPNPNTNSTTFETQNFAFSLTNAAPTSGTVMEVSGYGADGTDTPNSGGSTSNCTCDTNGTTVTRNIIQQSDTGPYYGTNGNLAAYEVDSCPGNSGGPVWVVATGQATAIHHGGFCDTLNYNVGTLVTHPGLLSAIQTLSGTPQNDECNGAIQLFQGSNGPFGNQNATSSPPPWSCTSLGTRDLWYRYTPQSNGSCTFSTCAQMSNTFDTVIEVFDGTCGNLVSLACNDDTSSCSLSYLSTVTVAASASQTLYARVGGYNNSSGSFLVNITELPFSNPAPNISSISPTSTLVASSGRTLTINGSGFVSSSRVLGFGSPLTPATVSANQHSAG